MNAKQIQGLPVIGIAEGARLGKVHDVYIDLGQRRVLGFVITPEETMPNPQDSYLDPEDIRSIGPDAVMVESQDAILGQAMRKEIGSLVNIDSLMKRNVMTEDGENVGSVAEIDFEPPDFKFTQLEASRGLFQSTLKISFDDVISIGPELIVVSNAVAAKAKPEAEAPEAEAPEDETPKAEAPETEALSAEAPEADGLKAEAANETQVEPASTPQPIATSKKAPAKVS